MHKQDKIETVLLLNLVELQNSPWCTQKTYFEHEQTEFDKIVMICVWAHINRWKDNPSMPKGLVYEGVNTMPMEYSGGSAAQSSLLHCFDELLGIKHEEKSGRIVFFNAQSIKKVAVWRENNSLS